MSQIILEINTKHDKKWTKKNINNKSNIFRKTRVA